MPTKWNAVTAVIGTWGGAADAVVDVDVDEEEETKTMKHVSGV